MMLMMSTVSFADQRQATVRVDGLACPFCAFGLEKKLKSIEGVEKLEIKVNDGLAILTFGDSAKIDEKLIAKKVGEAGFTPGEIKVASKKEKEMMSTNGQKVSLNITGMTCDGCAAQVTNALEQIDCVQEVKVDLETGGATFVCTDASFDRSKFVQAVNGMGFKAALQKK
jgi:mercuric ion binding protein